MIVSEVQFDRLLAWAVDFPNTLKTIVYQVGFGNRDKSRILSD
jgi:hypothetical protein